jgi:hypothetical protein
MVWATETVTEFKIILVYEYLIVVSFVAKVTR